MKENHKKLIMEIYVNARFLTQNLTGVQRYAIELSKQLKRLYNGKIKFVCPKNVINKKVFDELDTIIIGKHGGHLWEQWDLPQYLRKHGNPLLLCLCNTAPLYYKNKIVTVHDVAFMAYPQTFSKSFLYVYRFMIPRIMRLAKKVITVSEFSKEEIVKYYGIDREKINVVYNAVGADFCKMEDARLKKQKYILAVSSLNYRKNFLAVLKAFSILEKTDKETALYIIGDLKNTNFAGINIEQYINNPRINFLGRVSDNELIRYYSNAAAFIYPSIYEGFGIPPLEAQRCGCKVIVADIPPLREVVADSGIYCNPYDVNDIASKMLSSITDSNDLFHKGYTSSMRFSWKTSAEKIKGIIEDN